MNLFNNFIEHFVRIFSNFWLSSSSMPSTGNTSASLTSLEGTSNIFGDEPFGGTTTITTASALSAAISETPEITYNNNVTQAYVESMNINELNEFVEKLENIKLEEKPKTLTKTINNNYHT